MTLKLYQVDAFTTALFGGNPAAVCPLGHWIDENLLQQIAAENNLSETAFFVPGEHPLQIRWFTPTTEVDLCGHATLASAHVLSQHLGYRDNPIQFNSLSGPISVIVEGKNTYTLDFPTDVLERLDPKHPVIQFFNPYPVEVYRGKSDFLLVYTAQSDIENMEVNFAELGKFPSRGVIVTAPGITHDFVSRGFFPQTGINEDPATGSAHTTLTPYWANKLDKTTFRARQVSKRGGEFECELKAVRTLITGSAVSYLSGEIFIPDH